MDDAPTKLRDLIHERTGLYFRDYQIPGFLSDRLELLRENSGCGSLTEFHHLLSTEGDASSQAWQKVFASLSKPVSGFYRQRETVRCLVDQIVPRLAARNARKTLKIWSAGCATGEEPVAIAIALSEAGWFDRLNIEIHASDANPAAIESARQGRYDNRRLAALEPVTRSKYFSEEGDQGQVDPALHRRIHFAVANFANEAEIAELAAADVIICRNVFIYFSEPAIERTVSLFGKYLAEGGYFIGDGGDYFSSLMSRQSMFRNEKGDPSWVWTKQ